MNQDVRKAEACSLVLGDTLDKDFPLILVIGREPNNHCNVIDKVGTYPSPQGCTFWARSHELISRYTGLQPHEFKDQCLKQNASPIVFSDASPLGLDGRYTPYRKKKLRQAITPEELADHANTVFSQSNIISRTKFVLISGVEGCGLKHAMPFITEQCDSHQIPYVHIASLSAMTKNHTQAIRMQQIGGTGKTIITACTNEFFLGPVDRAA